MKRQFKYAFADIWQKKLYFILFFLQLLIIIMLVTVSYFFILKKERALNNLEAKFDTSNSYYLSVDSKKNFINGSEMDNFLHNMYEYITGNDDYLLFSSVANYSELNDVPKNSLSIVVEYGPNKVDAYKTLAISYDFIDIFNLSLTKGAFFPENWQYSKEESIPVVLGYDFQKLFNIDDEFTDENDLTYKVVGFLEAGTGYINISGGDGVTELNDVILTPINVASIDNLYETGNIDYDSYFEGATLIVKSKSDLENLRNRLEKSDEFSLKFNNLQNVAKYMEMTTKESVSVFMFVAVLFIVLSTTLVVVNTLEFVRKNLREFSIHIFCGATQVDIALRIFLQIFIVWFLAAVASFSLNYFILDGSTIALLSVAGLTLLFCVVTCIPSFGKLFKLQVSEIIRRKE